MSNPNADFPATRAMGVQQNAIPPVPLATTTPVMNASQINLYMRCTNAGAKAVSLSVVDDAFVPIGAEFRFRNVGAGALTFVPEAPVAINGNAAVAQNATAFIKKVAAQTYDMGVL